MVLISKEIIDRNVHMFLNLQNVQIPEAILEKKLVYKKHSTINSKTSEREIDYINKKLKSLTKIEKHIKKLNLYEKTKEEGQWKTEWHSTRRANEHSKCIHSIYAQVRKLLKLLQILIDSQIAHSSVFSDEYIWCIECSQWCNWEFY